VGKNGKRTETVEDGRQGSPEERGLARQAEEEDQKRERKFVGGMTRLKNRSQVGLTITRSC